MTGTAADIALFAGIFAAGFTAGVVVRWIQRIKEVA